MTHINGKKLFKARKDAGLSLRQLEELSGVSVKTIAEIEHGKRKARANTLERLARALRREPQTLLEGEQESAAPSSNWLQSKMTVMMDDNCRNALLLASLRFKVSEVDILNLAPFLFVWAAEASLRRREAALSAIIERLDEVEKIRTTNLKHLTHQLHDNLTTDVTIPAERESIEARDLFGKLLEEKNEEFGPLARGYQEYEQNPLLNFLKSLAADMSDDAEFESIDSYGWTRYEICKREALAVVGGDEKAAEEILSGRAPLHEMPKELFDKERASDRAQWAKTKGAERTIELPDLNLNDLGL